jgi:sec-independent protein translocase protein TatA
VLVDARRCPIVALDFDQRELNMFEGLMQPTHLLVILAIVLIFFGGKKLPELGRGLGEAIRGFKSAVKDEESSAVEPTSSRPGEKTK